MRNFPEYPDDEDLAVRDLALSVGCDQFLLANSAYQEAGSMADTIAAYGADCDWMNVFRKRLYQRGIEFTLRIEKGN